ncbi:hypothetical protein [Chelativorans salis]|uniref:Tat pathway signal sequence domain protein n=1 Tax=Chelativorans salis TaxID=2978478 RepID=A0ABT2LHT4_9HYPH|nr:hypothetical protein [Chelativorans sp. EGI FJ00035]MCT7374126.1 hypothetical protein [Chelativorans sp. EGI FJ00035]
MSWARTSAAAVLICLLAGPSGASSEEKSFSIELNDAVDVGSGCRLVYVAYNGTGVPLEETSYDVFTFDGNGKVAQSLVFQFGGFPAGKTKVMQFDLPEQPCSDISRLLINEVTRCRVDGADSPICLDALETSTRTPIAFGW